MIYWDHNATSPLRRRVKERMAEACELYSGNPNSSHSLGQTSRAAIEKSRRTMASQFGCQPSEIIFTASATESNFIALWGLWLERTKQFPEKKKILVSPLEHSSVHENILFLAERFGAEIIWMPLSSKGTVDLEKTEKLLKTEPLAFVACIGAQNETGIIQPWDDLAVACKAANIPFHSDLVQCVGRLPLHLTDSKVSTATLSFHKVGGPKGVGILYVRDQVKLEAMLRGGSQERKRRAGTENILSIVAAEALVEEVHDLENIFKTQVSKVRDEFESLLKSKVSPITIVGENDRRISNTSFVIFHDIKSDALLMSLDFKGICASSGSACSSGVITPSRILLELGYSKTDAVSAVRFSLSPENSLSEIKTVAEAVQETVAKLKMVA